MTYIRSALLDALRKSSNVNTKLVPTNFVYEYRTVYSLATYLSQLALSDSATMLSTESVIRRKVEEMHKMVEKYSSMFPPHIPLDGYPPPSGIIVLLTGSTGGLGCPLLAKLIQDGGVEKVYALNRSGGKSVMERQSSAFRERQMDLSILASPKLRLLEADLTGELLGLPRDVYEEVRGWTLFC